MSFSDAEIGREEKISELKGRPWLSSPISRTIVNSYYAGLITLAINPIPERFQEVLTFLSETEAMPTLSGYAKLFALGDTAKGSILEEFWALLAEPPKLGKKALKSAQKSILIPTRFADCIHRGALFHAYTSYALARGLGVEEAVEFSKEQSLKAEPSLFFIEKQDFLLGVAKSNTGGFLRYLAFTGAVIEGGKLGGVDMSKSISLDYSEMIGSN